MTQDRSRLDAVLLWVDLPAPDAVTAGSLVVSGWAFRRGGARIVSVEARLGDRQAVLRQGLHRPDVALELGEPHANWCGFEGTLAVAESSEERAERLVVRATDEQGETGEVEVPIRILPAGRPWLELESRRWLGDWLELEGWFIWAASVPPRRLELHVDGAKVAEAVPNLSRPDVARRFPSLPASSCRGFRIATLLRQRAIRTNEPASVRVVAVDARGEVLERSALVEPQVAETVPNAGAEALATAEQAIAHCREKLGRDPIVLDWHSGLPLAARHPGLTVFRPFSEEGDELPYLDGTVDLVVTERTAGPRVAEARRVAALGTVEAATLRWQDTTPKPPTPATPPTAAQVSIVVPLCRGGEGIDASLARVRETLPTELRCEVIVVDDGSSAARTERLRVLAETWPSLRVLRDESSAGFAARANRGAELARGERLVFLGSSALPRGEWLTALVWPLATDRSVAVVCGKLLLPNGTLREAGAILLADGSRRSIGRGDVRPNRSQYEFVREVDTGSSALLAVRRTELLERGGFDPRYGSAETAVADLCLRLRESGGRVLFQPASVAVDAGDEPTEGSGAEAAGPTDDRARLRSRFRKALSKQPPRSSHVDTEALATRPGVRRVLICAPRMPEFDRECGSQRALHFVELMQEAGWAVSYLALESVAGDRYVRLLQQRGVATYAGPDSIRAGDEYLEDVGELIGKGHFDLAIVAFWSVAEKLLPRFRELSPRTRVVVDSIDLHYLREERAALVVSRGGEPAVNAGSRLERKRRELAVYAAADAVLTVSTREAELLERAIDGATPVVSVPLLEELAPVHRGFRDRTGLLFIGNFHHPPNLEGLEYLCTEILPRLEPELLARHPLRVIGNGADHHVRAAVARIDGAVVAGWVPSVVPYLESALVSVIPLLHGAGTKGKLIQALMVGTPSVSTSIGTEGLDLEPGRHVLVADSAEEFADAIRAVAGDARLWTRLAREGRRQIERAHGREQVRARLRSAVEAATASSLRRRLA